MDTIVCADALSYLATLPDQSVNCVVTSPPYYNLRDYGVAGQLGSEATMRGYIDSLVSIFHEIYRVLRADGTVWVNLGDTYSGGGRGDGRDGSLQRTNPGSQTTLRTKELPAKSLMMVPARFAIAMIDDGWILRNEIVWNKPNPMPESVKDRATRAHEMIYMFSKSGRYWYDSEPLKTPVKPQSIKRHGRAVTDSHKMIDGAPGQTPHSFSRPRPNTHGKGHGSLGHNHADIENRYHIPIKQDTIGKRTYAQFNERYEGADVPMANARSVWTFAAVGSKEKHYATFPRELPRRCIVAGCPIDGVVLDPFMGSGTTALVARELHRHYIGCDLNEIYVRIAQRRLDEPFQPMLREFA